MVSLEQVKLLETRIDRAIGYVEKVTVENTAFREKLDAYQKRIDELEVLVRRFRDDQGRIEDGILAALDKLNKFEDALEKKLSPGRPSQGKKGTPASGAGGENGGEEEKAPVTPPSREDDAPTGTEAPGDGAGDAAEEAENGSPGEPILPGGASEIPNPQDPAEGELDIF
jgi:hypothetical protein